MSALAREAERAAPPPPPAGLRVVRALAEGGMGWLWLCERALPGGFTQRVVLKRPKRDEALRPEAVRARFDDEARAHARARHGNLVALLDAGRDAHGPYLLLEWVDGLDLHQLCEALRARDGGAFDAECVAWVAHEAARGVAAAHAACDDEGEPAPILHRDLSPQNVLLSRAGEVKVTDFGIAWAAERASRTTTGVVVGNLRYIAPEMLEGRDATARTDVYGLGRLLDVLLELAPDDASTAPLRALAKRCTRRDADERPASVADVLDALCDAAPTLCRGRARVASTVDACQRPRPDARGLQRPPRAYERHRRPRRPPLSPRSPLAPTARREVARPVVALARGHRAVLVPRAGRGHGRRHRPRRAGLAVTLAAHRASPRRGRRRWCDPAVAPPVTAPARAHPG
ncbi:MAG: serine/threonine-protein kinase [Polyangiales bacterium]